MGCMLINYKQSIILHTPTQILYKNLSIITKKSTFPKMSAVNQCPTIFCGCQSIHYEYYNDNQSLQLSGKLYVYILFIVVAVMVSVKLSLEWFIYKDYFPLKQKSPILTILMIFGICVQIILYPLIYSINYFTYVFTWPHARSYFRAIQVGFEYSVYTVYLLRCLRIAYAHETDKSRRKTFSFRVFQREDVLAICVIMIAIVRGVVVVFDPCTNDSRCNNFAFGFEIGALNPAAQLQTYFIVRSLVVGFIWQLILILCMLLHKNVNYRYSMNNEISLILAATQITSLFHIITLFSTLEQPSTMGYLCNISSLYPMTEFLRVLNLVVAFVVSILLPLFRKKVYHVLLPTGPHYGFVKTMRNFLMEKQFLRVFSRYLQNLDQQQGGQQNTKLLKFWQQMVMLKLSSNKQGQQEKLDSIITLVQQATQNSILSEHEKLIQNLKGTINGMQDSFLNNQQKQEINCDQSFGSLKQVRKQRYRESINQKVDELEQITLQKLNKIYSERYCYTESYLHLRQIMNDYKKVNLNLIMLNMALIVDSDHQFN